MKVWAILVGFVGIQMAWNLQLFVGDRGRSFQLFRHNEGNFYTAVVYALERLAHGEDRPRQADPQAGRSPAAGTRFEHGITEPMPRFDLPAPAATDTGGAGAR